MELRADRAADCESGCETATEALLGGLPEGIQTGELTWEAICWEKATGMFLRRGSGLPGAVSGGKRWGIRDIPGFPTKGVFERVSETRHERPGVYSVYDASSVTSAGRAAKRIGVAALAVKGTANAVVTLTRLQHRRGCFRRGRGRCAGNEYPAEAAVCQRRIPRFTRCGRVKPPIRRRIRRRLRRWKATMCR